MTYRLLQGDALQILRTLPAASVHCCVTSPPYYGLRDYGHDGQIGAEQTPAEYVAKLVQVFDQVRRVLRPDGTLWLNLGDSYANDGKWGGETGGKQAYLPDSDRRRVGREKRSTALPPKSLIGIPWRVAFALQDNGWILRSDIIWHKTNAMPESVADRPTKAHEYLFLLTKSARYYYDAHAIAEPAQFWQGQAATFERTGPVSQHVLPNQTTAQRNKRSVWSIATRPYPEAHFATYPVKLVQPCILAGCPAGGTVLDPFSGAATTGVAAIGLGRAYIGIELNPAYIALAERRLSTTQPSLLATDNNERPLAMAAD